MEFAQPAGNVATSHIRSRPGPGGNNELHGAYRFAGRLAIMKMILRKRGTGPGCAKRGKLDRLPGERRP
jgi:hypothetical protein